jgi:hypothetical protein
VSSSPVRCDFVGANRSAIGPYPDFAPTIKWR